MISFVFALQVSLEFEYGSSASLVSLRKLELITWCFLMFNFQAGKATPVRKMWMNVKTALAKMVECVWICQELFCADVRWVGIFTNEFDSNARYDK